MGERNGTVLSKQAILPPPETLDITLPLCPAVSSLLPHLDSHHYPFPSHPSIVSLILPTTTAVNEQDKNTISIQTVTPSLRFILIIFFEFPTS